MAVETCHGHDNVTTRCSVDSFKYDPLTLSSPLCHQCTPSFFRVRFLRWVAVEAMEAHLVASRNLLAFIDILHFTLRERSLLDDPASRLRRLTSLTTSSRHRKDFIRRNMRPSAPWYSQSSKQSAIKIKNRICISIVKILFFVTSPPPPSLLLSKHFLNPKPQKPLY